MYQRGRGNYPTPRITMREPDVNAKNLWTVCADIIRTKDGWTVTKQVPSFMLNGNIQGFMTAEGAENIVNDLLNPFNDETIKISCSIARV